MYDLTGDLDGQDPSDGRDAGEDIDPLHLIKRDVFDSWTNLRLRVLAEKVSLAREGPVLHSILTMDGRLLAHQLGACAKVLHTTPSGSLLADEVGLGKTIEAGLIISELAARGRADRVLVLTPASLATQWRDELGHIFDMELVLADVEARREARRNGTTVWRSGRIVSSISTAKMMPHRERIQALDWDVVVVDEAHKLKDRKTQNFRLVQGLRTNVLLLLTATPIQNRLTELYNQVSLIDPRLLGTQESFGTHFFGDRRGVRVTNPEELRRRLSHIMIRNRRRNMPDLTMVERQGQTVSLTLSDEEAKLYDELTSFIRHEYRKAKRTRRLARGFLMVLYQRMLTSSTRAVAASLRKRMGHVEDQLLAEPDREMVLTHLHDEVTSMVDTDYSDMAPAVIYEPSMEPDRREALKKELNQLGRLCRFAERIEDDTKARKLRQVIGRLGDEKVLVFTEFRATQSYLAGLLEDDGIRTVTFHGGMSPEEKEEAVARFRGPDRVMISTESGGEGRNLQFCHILVNYDLPWNPMRVEQRIGRLHRIGQTHDVRIINFSTRETVEEYVLELLETKIRLFEEVVGDLDLILGEVSDEGSFETMIMELISEGEEGDLAPVFARIGERIEESRHMEEEGSRDAAGAVIRDLDLSTRLDPEEALTGLREVQRGVMDFTREYLGSRDARVWNDGEWGLEGTASRSLMVTIGLDREFRLRFDRRTSTQEDPHPDEGDGAMAVALGLPILERMLEDCGKGGFTAFRRCTDVEGRGYATFHVVSVLRGMRDHRSMHTVHVDLETFETLDPSPSWPPGEGVVQEPGARTHEGEGDDGGGRGIGACLCYRVEAAYSTALRTVDRISRERARKLALENDRLCDLEIDRINTYHDDLEDELVSKERGLEDRKYELLGRIRASKSRSAENRYRKELERVNRKFSKVQAENSSERERLRRSRRRDLKQAEAKRDMRSSVELVAIGVTLPSE